ncbi:MAG TPA: nucleotidyltransferase family protein [Polyangiaceae bacterium]|nr:nucleotidyltransferase family protein [Polyangiaceae bacterium]
MSSAIILCAGFGTRLRPLTDELPKPLVPVGDRSILEHALAALEAAGIADLTINVHHLPAEFERRLARLATKVRVVVEAELRGTAGGVAGARAHFSAGPVLVWNGDILVEPPIEQLLQRCTPQSFCLGVAPRPLGEGTLGLDAEGHVVRLRGERFGTEERGGDYVGVLAIGADALAALPERGCLFGDAALPLLRAGGRVRSMPVLRPWTDAGDPASLLAANLAWLAGRGLDSHRDPSASVSPGVELRQALVGAGARIVGQGVLERCVVCPGATVVAPLRDALVAPSGRVIAVPAQARFGSLPKN